MVIKANKLNRATMITRHRNYKYLFLLIISILVVILAAPTSCTTPAPTVVLQEGNNLPRTQFQPKQSKELEDNRIGQMMRLDIYTEQEADEFVDQN